VDASTGTLYVSGLDHETTAGEPNSADRYFFGGGRRFVIASHDGGRTFGHSHPLDDVNNPDHSMGTISTTHGVLAAAYTTSATSTATDTACPCTVFETSRDDGANWDRHVIPQSSPAVADNSAQDVVQAYVAADPTHKGRFAVGVLENGGRNLVVHVTTDAGHTWTAHAVEQAAPTWIDNRPWIAYGADGALGVMWRRDYQNATCEQLERNAWFQQCPYDVYGAVSVRGDGRFRGPVRFTSARSQPSSTYAVGDDVSYATMSGGTLWATWGDWRTGDLDAWLGAYHYAG
jgi:hypothetical protein